MSNSVQVLAVPHQIQGEKFDGWVKPDLGYELLVKSLIAQVDFVFEEAAGRLPSVAQDLAHKSLGLGHYLDVDPSPDERGQYGIAKETGASWAIAPTRCEDSCRSEFIKEHRKREEVWLQKIQSRSFAKGLMICGTAHGLSFAFRLQCAGLTDVELHEYLPYNKLQDEGNCGHV